ncbi:Osmotically-inducible protein OsmY, contains BON domain [Pseudomonas flavescens]|uniref:Osmotically-inducible protein OsmY, contains BON domain n=1 Tax=Phytopseudomonas flavescens TaxID=29435 RepID=A0A1G8MGY6_9GAMM|nr:BON domain-containing protein [Pseudomonas flavescens]SDI67077.1 Osmotically-inducible protein OsmY, contains BON domain [Pseudomonas flavescens]
MLSRQFAQAVAITGFIALAPLAQAADQALARQVSDARQQGAIVTAFALNPHLNPFDIQVSVEDGTATLAGAVENAAERELAAELAQSIGGVQGVSNHIKVDPAIEVESTDEQARVTPDKTLAQRFDDATLAATVKSKLLWNSNTEGLDIQVRAENGVLSLSGTAGTPVAKELAGELATHTEGVREVHNHLSINTADSAAAEAQNAANDAAASISDTWITRKVTSSFLYSRNLDSLNIKVDTREGFVSLSGTVLSNAEKRLAVETARNIRGVRGVDADALRIAS